MFDLPTIWAAILALAIFVYVILDGFDLGIGIIFPLLDTKECRDVSMNSIAPIWDGNETWLVLGGGGLLAAFPLAYSIVLPALYAPIIIMLLALVFRGVAFEFRWRDPEHLKIWDRSFFWGSVIATFCQGIVLGAFVQGIEVDGRAYGGGWWDWLTPFSLVCGVALTAGYALLGSTWIIMKSEGILREKSYDIARKAVVITFIFMGVVSLWTPFLSPEIAKRWFSWPSLLFVSPVPLLVMVTSATLFFGLKNRKDNVPFLASIMLFLLCFVGLGIGVSPYIVPHAVTIADAAAPDKSLKFMLVGAVILIPLILTYTAYTYYVFRGKMDPDAGYH